MCIQILNCRICRLRVLLRRLIICNTQLINDAKISKGNASMLSNEVKSQDIAYSNNFKVYFKQLKNVSEKGYRFDKSCIYHQT